MTEAVLVGLLAVLVFIGPVLIAAWCFRNPTKDTRVALRKRNPYKDPKYRQTSIAVIDGARQGIVMVRGEIPPSVYNEKVADALRCAHKRGVRIRLICGPKVTMRTDGTHPVLDLAKEGVLELYFSPKNRQPHLVEADGSRIYLEEAHDEGAQTRRVWDIEGFGVVLPELQDEVLNFEKWPVRKVADVREKDANGKEIFHVCTPSTVVEAEAR